MKKFEQHVIDTLINGGIGVIPTDTIYGVVGRAEQTDTVERIYTVRQRDHKKACIVLISSYEDLAKFNVVLSTTELDFIKKYSLWPGKVSIIFPVLSSQYTYLTRGTNALAFRIPEVPELRDLISRTGPLIAPSANKEGNPPAHTIDMARKEFGETVDFYVDNGAMNGEASTIIKCTDGVFSVVREGAVQIPALS
jgi:L-threonylcarbamoyladenylate synthase